jgi:hypothetical protein
MMMTHDMKENTTSTSNTSFTGMLESEISEKILSPPFIA